MISYHPTAKTAMAATSGWRTAFSVGPVITQYIWSGMVWREGRRNSENFWFSDWCVLDFDSGEMSLAEAVKNFCDCIHVIGTTKSHQLEKGGIISDRFRVAIPWEKRISDINVLKFNLEEMTRRYPIDPACKDGARLFYPCKSVVSSSVTGYRKEVKAPPQNFGQPTPVAQRPAGRCPRYIQAWLDRPVAEGIRSMYFKIGAHLHKQGYGLGESIEMVAAARVGAFAKARDSIGEIRECVTAGWNKDRG